MRRSRALGVVALVMVVVAGAYATADAYDLVPGLVTLAPAPAPARPFPTAPGAVAPAPITAPLGLLAASAPVPSDARVGAAAQALVDDPRTGGSVGVLVADQLTGAVLASVEPGVARTAASTTKLLTATAVLGRLDHARTLDTRVVQESAEQIVLVAGGDMMLAPGAGRPDAVNGRAGLGDLAKQVARALTLAGRTTVRLAYDDHLFTGDAVNPGWAPTDVADGYVAPITGLAVNAGRTTDAEYAPRSTTPSLDAARTLAAALAADGITVTGTPARVVATPGAPTLGTVRSAPLSELVDYDLHVSDNTIAEVLGRLVALDEGLPPSFGGAAAAVLEAVRADGLDVAGTRLVGTSGLAPATQVTPALLVGVLRLVTDPAHPLLRDIAVDLPISGLSGTLADRYTSSPARGLVRAKTGSLTSVTSLAGTVQDADGRLLVFAVLVDHAPATGQAAAREAVDAFVSQLAGCGCRS